MFFCFMLYGIIFLKSLNSCIAATKIMHQSIPYGAFARLVSPGGGAFANLALPGGRAFANLCLLTRTRFPIRI